MARKSRRPIAEIERWTADQEKLARFEALVLVTQRATFIKSVLGLTESEERIRRHMKLICARHDTELRPGRGPGYDGRHLRQANVHQRYDCSLLLGWLLQSSDGGMAETGAGLVPDKLLDRMLYCYRRYLDLFVTTAARADVSFVMFYTLYRAQAVGDVQLRLCDNCGSQFVMLRTAHTVTCPICAVHRHARSRSRSGPLDLQTVQTAVRQSNV